MENRLAKPEIDLSRWINRNKERSVIEKRMQSEIPALCDGDDIGWLKV